MNSRERVLLALAHKEPDRVPIDYWATPEITAKLIKRFGFSSGEELLNHLDVDLRYIKGPEYIGPDPVKHADGSVEDIWGVPRIPVKVGSANRTGVYREVRSSPLETANSLDEIQNYNKWPSPDWYDYSCVQKQVQQARRLDKAVVFIGDRMNRCAQLKPAMYLRGMARILEDLTWNPEIAEYLFQRIAGFYLEYARRICEAASDGIDIFMTGDDFGMQNSLLMSPDMWRRFLRPGFKALIDLAKEYGYKTAHHSCGSIKPIIPEMIDDGLDILNPIQPDVHDMNPGELKEKFGDRLCFHGSISIQHTLPFGTVKDVQDEVRNRFETLGPGGGFIFCTAHNIQVDTPLENIVALFEAYREFGTYQKVK